MAAVVHGFLALLLAGATLMAAGCAADETSGEPSARFNKELRDELVRLLEEDQAE